MRAALPWLLVGAWLVQGCTEQEPDISTDTDTGSGTSPASSSGTTDPQPDDSTTTSSGTSEDTTSSGTTDPGATTVSEGDSCPLVGMFRACMTDAGTEGRAYCDDFDGLLLWGPCLTSAACELNDADCFGECTLEDGVPTWIEIDGGCGGSTSG